MDLNLSVFQEPRGVMRILHFVSFTHYQLWDDKIIIAAFLKFSDCFAGYKEYLLF